MNIRKQCLRNSLRQIFSFFLIGATGLHASPVELPVPPGDEWELVDNDNEDQPEAAQEEQEEWEFFVIDPEVPAHVENPREAHVQDVPPAAIANTPPPLNAPSIEASEVVGPIENHQNQIPNEPHRAVFEVNLPQVPRNAPITLRITFVPETLNAQNALVRQPQALRRARRTHHQLTRVTAVGLAFICYMMIKRQGTYFDSSKTLSH